MNRKNIDHETAVQVNYTASEMNIVACAFSLDKRMCCSEGHILELEALACELRDSTAHLDSGMRHLRIDSASMSNTDSEIDITHYLREKDIERYRSLISRLGLRK